MNFFYFKPYMKFQVCCKATLQSYLNTCNFVNSKAAHILSELSSSFGVSLTFFQQWNFERFNVDLVLNACNITICYILFIY